MPSGTGRGKQEGTRPLQADDVPAAAAGDAAGRCRSGRGTGLRGTGRRMDRRARTCELLEQVGLPAAFISRYPHELSGGQLQRVCIARALAIRPRILLLDEAISSLDASTQVQIMDLLIGLRRDLGLSYLFITHDLTSITYLCDRVVFINDGTIVEQVDDIRRIAMIRNDYARKLLESVMGIGVEHGSGTARTGQERYAAIA